MTATVRWHESDQLETISAEPGARRARSAGSAAGTNGADPVPHFLRDPEVGQVFEVVDVSSQQVLPGAASRAARPPEIAVTVDVDDGSDYMLVVRHPSGALTFHDGEEPGTKRTLSGGKSRKNRPKSYTIEFRAPVALSANDTVRRGLFDGVIDAVVDAIVVRITDFVAKTAVQAAEKAIWKALGRKRGLFKVVPRRGAGVDLKSIDGKATAGPNGRALLLIHGTFSTTQSGFGDLANSDFFDRLKDEYGDAIYGFDHFTVSVTPERNAIDLLASLPPEGVTFDVVTHSRGGLVLRNLVERRDSLKNSDRFRLGRAALVASPNEGTPLATPGRWDNTIGWIANILDLFPPNPVTSNSAMVARWIVWFVKVGVDAADGLDSMNQGGAQLRELQQPPSPEQGQYSALVSNHEPDRRLWARALDLGVDWFFDGANDLVVPTTGGWRIDRIPESIPGNQIGAFGPGGNIDAGEGQVSHFGFFGRSEAQDFLVRALKGEPQSLPVVDPEATLPSARRTADARIAADDFQPFAPTAVRAQPEAQPEEPVAPRTTRSVSAQPLSSVFELIVLDPDQIQMLGLPPGEGGDDNTPFLYAAYGGARVAVPFQFKKTHVPPDIGDEVIDSHLKAMVREIRDRWGRLFGYHRRVRAYLDGASGGNPLSDAELRLFGELLFETLFPDQVRRLYDVARARESDKLFVIFTSMIPWVFDMPWEFARDAERGSFLATEDVHFIRNVLTSTPVEKLPPRDRLRMLIAVAEPRDQVQLSAAEEVAKLHRALSELSSEGLLEFDILQHATATTLHDAVANGGYDVVHFIGHGYWDRTSHDSGLVLEDQRGQSSPLGGRPLREVLSGRGIRLVFLNACDTGRSRAQSGDKRNSLAGIAQDLFSHGAPNVIANQFPVGDIAAVAFARSIYSFLAHGKSVAQAVREARIAANYEKAGQNMDWAIPVVYARDPEDRLVQSASWRRASALGQ